MAEDLSGVLCGYHLAQIRPRANCHGAFLARAFSAIGPRDQFQISANGITRFGLGGDAIRASLFPLPPDPEQRAIAAFLDRKTTKIDALVAKKERLIQRLQEKRNAITAQAISAAPDVKEVRLGHYVDLLAGYAFPSSAFSHDPEDIRLLRGANVSTGFTRWDDVAYWPRTDIDRFRAYQLVEGDIVFGMDRPWVGGGIRVAEVRKRDLPSLLLQRVAQLRAKTGLLNLTLS